MIDVDERGRAAAADLRRATAAVAGTDDALNAVLRGAVLIGPGEAGRRRSRRPVLAGAVLGVAAVVLVALVLIRPGTNNDESPGGTFPVPSRPIVTTPGSTSAVAPTTNPQRTVPATVAPSTDVVSTASPTLPDVVDPLRSVARADELPDVVAARSGISGMPAGELSVGEQPIPGVHTARLAVQAPNGLLVIDNAGDGLDPIVDPATGQGVPIPHDLDAADDKRVVSVGDVATLDGVPTLLAIRGYPCNTEGAKCGGLEPTLIALDGSIAMQVVIRFGGGIPPIGALGGRFSLSDTGLVAGVAQLAGSAQVGFLLDSTVPADPDGPSGLELGESLGLNGVATSVPSRRVDAVTVDQSGQAVAWLDAAGLTVVDLVTQARRSFPLPARPATTLPVLDLALAGGSIADGAVLLSAMGEPAYVLDLTDGSVTQVPDFLGTLTFSAVPR